MRQMLIKPFISIIIPVYNSEKYIVNCLNSILIQNGAIPFEIICVDDGSLDNSVEIITEFKLKYSFIKIIQQKNAGQGSARNTGFSISNGKYIWFVDSDDCITQNSFQVLQKTISEHDADILCFDLHSTPDRTFRNEVSFNSTQCRHISKTEAMLFEHVGPCSRIYRRDFLLQQNFTFPPFYFAEDLAETSRLFATCNKIFKSPIKPYVYYTNAQSASAIYHMSEKKKYDFLEVLRILKNNSQKYSSCKNEFEYLLYNHALFFMNNLLFDKKNNLDLINKIKEIVNTIHLDRNIFLRIQNNIEKKYEKSISWKISYPLRVLKKIIKKLRRAY